MANLRVVKDDDPAPEFDPEVVDCLREALRRAEAGQVKSVFIVTEDAESVYEYSTCTMEALPIYTFSKLVAEQEIRELMGFDDETRH
jgi:hypothetical protein